MTKPPPGVSEEEEEPPGVPEEEPPPTSPRRSRERRGLREFWDEKRNDTGQTIIYRFKNISSGF
jgi:hypothetical protein